MSNPLTFSVAVFLTAFSFQSVVARPTVGLLLKVHNTEGFWGEVEKGAKEAAEAAGMDLVIKGTNNVSNSTAQIRLLESLANEKIDALVITPTNAEQLIAPLKAQAAKGLKIVVAEGELAAKGPFPFVGYDQVKLASAAATAFAELLNDTDEVALFRSVSDQVVVQRDKVILARLKELRPNLRWYLDFYAISNEHSSVNDKGELLLQKHPDTKLFIGSSTPATLALLAAAKKQSEPGKAKIAGFGFRLTPDIVQSIEAGTIQIFVCQIPREIGYKSVAAAVALIRGEPVPDRTDVNFLVVTKANLNLPEIQALKTP